MKSRDIKAANLRAVIDGRSEKLLAHIQRYVSESENIASVSNCLSRGYAPKGYGLADFSILKHQGLFHLFHIPRVAGNSCIDPANEHWIGHAVSRDLDTWITRNPVLCNDPGNYFESAHVWAPFAFGSSLGTFMFYTGLSMEPSQVLCMAQSHDPELEVWRKDDGNPIIPLQGFDWHWKNHKGHLRHARDPHVVQIDQGFLLAYTAMHREGCPAVGGLFSNNLREWEDLGPILYRPMDPAPWMPESVNIQPMGDGRWVLIPSQSPGLEYYLSSDPTRWHDAKPMAIEYANGQQSQPIGLEIISTLHADRWLVAFFETDNNRMFIGSLETACHPWRLTRLASKGDLTAWNTIFA